jgi:hypothetical protein
VGSIPGRCFGSLARRKVVKYWCNSPGTMVRKLPACMTEILLEKGVKWHKQTNKKIITLTFLESLKIFHRTDLKESTIDNNVDKVTQCTMDKIKIVRKSYVVYKNPSKCKEWYRIARHSFYKLDRISSTIWSYLAFTIKLHKAKTILLNIYKCVFYFVDLTWSQTYIFQYQGNI